MNRLQAIQSVCSGFKNRLKVNYTPRIKKGKIIENDNIEISIYEEIGEELFPLICFFTSKIGSNGGEIEKDFYFSIPLENIEYNTDLIRILIKCLNSCEFNLTDGYTVEEILKENIGHNHSKSKVLFTLEED